MQNENATIIELNNSDVEGVEAGFYHLYGPEWTKENNNLSIHERPSFIDKIVLQPVESDLSTTSDSTDYKPLSESHIILSDNQKLALMEVNGHDNQDNLVVTNAHMNLNSVNYPTNLSPTSITLDNLSIDENSYRDNGILIDLENGNWSSLIGNITGNDAVGDNLTNLTYTIVAGYGDDSMFTIKNNNLQTKTNT